MNPFTDDDLKRLKENMEWKLHQGHTFVPMGIENELNALIARLEAAESLIHKMFFLDDTDTETTLAEHNKKVEEFTQALAAWRKAAGK